MRGQALTHAGQLIVAAQLGTTEYRQAVAAGSVDGQAFLGIFLARTLLARVRSRMRSSSVGRRLPCTGRRPSGRWPTSPPPAEEIAAQLYLSLRTVENCLHRAYEKLGVSGRAELAAALEA